jgi:hypothetical protein
MRVFEIKHALLVLIDYQHVNADEALKHPACCGGSGRFAFLIGETLAMEVKGLAYPILQSRLDQKAQGHDHTRPQALQGRFSVEGTVCH